MSTTNIPQKTQDQICNQGGWDGEYVLLPSWNLKGDQRRVGNRSFSRAMKDASTCEKVVVVHAEFLFRVVPVDREWAASVNVVHVRFVHHPITEPAEHWDNSKLLLEWESIELYEHHFQAASPHVAVLEAVFVNQAEHCPQIGVGEIRICRRQLVSETLVVGL
jgi:hypothetical protein